MPISPFHEVESNLLSSRIQPKLCKQQRLNGINSPLVGDFTDLPEYHA
jgi:hypothetical protein